MAPKEAFKPKPSAKSEMNKPKGGKAKEEKRKADKEKKAAKNGTGPIAIGGKNQIVQTGSSFDEVSVPCM